MMKLNNKTLLILLAALVAVYVFSRVFRSPRMESTVRKELVVLDTAAITEVRILPAAARGVEVRLRRDGKTWNLEEGGEKYRTDSASVANLLQTLTQIDAERMVSRKKDKWEEYNVGEKGTDVLVFYGADQKADLHIGKSGITQGGAGMYGGNVGGYTYVRLGDEDEVFVVNGFLEATFNKGFDEWKVRPVAQDSTGMK